MGGHSIVTGRRPSILVVSREESEAGKRASERARFRGMTEALRAGGLMARHVTPPSLDDFRRDLAELEPDMVFCSFFRFPGQAEGEGYLYDAALREGVAWIGSRSSTMELALSKPRMKACWRASGIPTPDWFVVRRLGDGTVAGLDRIEGAEGFPLIVKPASEGNSRGIDEGSVVRSPSELRARVGLIVEEYGEAIVERFVSGGGDSREFTVAMIGNGTNAIVAPIEIGKAASPVVSEADKELQATKVLPVGDAMLRDRVCGLALRAFLASGVRDYSRCDIMLHEGQLYAIELNGQPMVPDRWFEACAREAGLDGTQYIEAIALAGISGNARIGHAHIPIPREMARTMPRPILERLTS